MSNTNFPEPFNPNTETGSKFAPIPPGDYLAQIVDAKVAPPSTGNGFMLTAVWKIIAGQYENRQIWQRITITHSNEQAVTIGRRTLTDLCHALGIQTSVGDAKEFLFRPARIKVKIQPDNSGGYYGDQNQVTRIMPPSPPSAPTQPRGPVPPVTGGPPRSGPAGTAPWHQS